MALPITLDQLEVFSVVARTGGFADAARELSRTQSAVSKAIAAMERLLDFKLFVRSAQGARLTTEGVSMLASARSVLDTASMFQADASRVGSAAAEGVISVAIDVFCPGAPVFDALGALEQQFPGTAVVVRTEQLAWLSRLVQGGTCALGVCGPRGVDHRELDSEFLGTTWMVPVCSAEHPVADLMAERGAVSREALAAHTHLYLTERADWQEESAPAPNEGVTERRWWKLSDLHTKHQCLRRGFGWGMMPLHVVQPELDAGTLVRLRIEGRREQWPHEHYLVRRRGEAMGPVAEFLYARLRENLHQGSKTAE